MISIASLFKINYVPKETLFKLLNVNPKIKVKVFLLIAVAVTLDRVSCTIMKHFQKSLATISCRLSEQMLASALQVRVPTVGIA